MLKAELFDSPPLPPLVKIDGDGNVSGCKRRFKSTLYGRGGNVCLQRVSRD